MPRKHATAFTLAELLIALAILGVIATFTIPKVLQAQQDTRLKAVTKEAVGAISTAYDLYRRANGAPTATTGVRHLGTYLNYIKQDTVRLIDHVQGWDNVSCATGGITCLVLANGAIVWDTGRSFGGSATTNAAEFSVDPDGQYSGTTNGPGKSIQFFLYYNGRIASWANCDPGTTDDGGPVSACPNPSNDPPWFSWN